MKILKIEYLYEEGKKWDPNVQFFLIFQEYPCTKAVKRKQRTRFQHNHILMATSLQNLVPPFSCRRTTYTSPCTPIAIFRGGRGRNARKMLRVCRAMVEKTVQGASSTFAKEMERLSAKESLLLAVSAYPFLLQFICFFLFKFK